MSKKFMVVEEAGTWFVKPYATKREGAYIIVNGGKNPDSTYRHLQETLGELDEDFNYEPVPRDVVAKRISETPLAKRLVTDKPIEKGKRTRTMKVPSNWHELAKRDVPELWETIEKIPVERYVPENYNGPQATKQERDEFCYRLLRLAVWMSYAFKRHGSTRDEVVLDVLSGLESTSRNYMSGRYKPSSLLEEHVRNSVFYNKNKRQNEFGLTTISAWRKYERALEEKFASGDTNLLLGDRYNLYLESGGVVKFGNETDTLTCKLRRFARAEQMYFRSFGEQREDLRTSSDKLPYKLHPKINDQECIDKYIEIGDEIQKVLDTLPTANEIIVLSLRYGLTGIYYTQTDTAKMLSLTPARIRQIEIKAIRRLQHPTRWKKLEQFL